MYKTYIHITLTLLLLPISIVAQSSPRLTVLIAVDGLNKDNMELLQPFWQAGGLRTLQEEADKAYISYPFDVKGGNETLATLITGSMPSQHGLWYDQFFKREDREVHSFFEDKDETGIGTASSYSLRRMPVPTLTDLFRVKYGKRAKVYAVGQQAASTMLLAGHSADACCWLDKETHRWVTTSYYANGLPSAADEENISGRIDEMCHSVWQPKMNPSSYLKPSEQEMRQGFYYTTGDVLHTSPKINSLVIDMALRLQQSEQLGTDGIPDMLLLNLTTLSPQTVSDQIETAEQEEMYITLNQYLGFFLQQMEERIGKDNLQVVVVGLPKKGQSTALLQQMGLTYKPFVLGRAAALTSVYLMALYGHERWLDGYWGNAIFLNRTLIEQKQMDLHTLQQQVADFLMDFEGVQVAYPRNEALLVSDITNKYAKHYIGDVMFNLQPSWLLCQEENEVLDNVSDTQPTSLIMWYVPNNNTKKEYLRQGIVPATDFMTILLNQL